jgi:hypothetical protein
MHAETILKYSPISLAHRPYLTASDVILRMKSSKKSGKIVLKMMIVGTFRPEASVQHFERQINRSLKRPKKSIVKPLFRASSCREQTDKI